MQGRLENQIKAEKRINNILSELPKVVTEYYMNLSTTREFRTCLVYVQKIRLFLSYYSEREQIDIQDIDFNKIKEIDISIFLKSIEFKMTKEGKKYTSFSYRKQMWSILNGFFSYMMEKEYIEKNPVEFIKRPDKNDDVKHVFLEESDIKKIKKAIIKGAGTDKAISYQKKWKERDLAIFYVFMSTGMRESALCEIDINRISFRNNTLEVTDKEHRVNTYTITPQLKDFLLTWMRKRRKILQGEKCDALFISNRKTRITARNVIFLINKYSKEALGYTVSPHRLRAAYGNIMYKQTGDIQFVSGTMKHKNISTTKIYIKSDEKEINDKAADIISGIL